MFGNFSLVSWLLSWKHLHHLWLLVSYLSPFIAKSQRQKKFHSVCFLLCSPPPAPAGTGRGRGGKGEREKQGGHALAPLHCFLRCFFCILHFGRGGSTYSLFGFLCLVYLKHLISRVEWPTNSFFGPSQFPIDSEEDWFRQKETSSSTVMPSPRA